MEQVNQFIEQLQVNGDGVNLDGLTKPIDDLKNVLSIVAIVIVVFWLISLISNLIQKRSISRIRKEVKEINAKLDALLAKNGAGVSEAEDEVGT
ncbi:MAG: hypothetical protein ACOX0Z_02695 [Candidatus Nanosyncoccaceae bacterium]|jgi:uncharacterized membrane protein